MGKHDGCERRYYHPSRAWYGEAHLRDADYVDEIMIGFYGIDPDGGTTGEFAIRWMKLGGKVTPFLCVYDDAWNTLWECRDVLERLAQIDGQDVEPDVIRQILEECGIRDATETESPYPTKPKTPRKSVWCKPDSSLPRED